jgi:hypothetical protein
MAGADTIMLTRHALVLRSVKPRLCRRYRSTNELGLEAGHGSDRIKCTRSSRLEKTSVDLRSDRHVDALAGDTLAYGGIPCSAYEPIEERSRQHVLYATREGEHHDTRIEMPVQSHSRWHVEP